MKYYNSAESIANSEKIKSEKNVHDYLCAQTASIKSRTTYTEVNMVTQCTVEHLVLTLVGMKKGIKL